MELISKYGWIIISNCFKLSANQLCTCTCTSINRQHSMSKAYWTRFTAKPGSSFFKITGVWPSDAIMDLARSVTIGRVYGAGINSTRGTKSGGLIYNIKITEIRRQHSLRRAYCMRLRAKPTSSFLSLTATWPICFITVIVLSVMAGSVYGAGTTSERWRYKGNLHIYVVRFIKLGFHLEPVRGQ